jgi:hypothetical protein
MSGYDKFLDSPVSGCCVFFWVDWVPLSLAKGMEPKPAERTENLVMR